MRARILVVGLMSLLCCCEPSLGQAVGAGAARFDGHRLIRVNIQTPAQLQTLLSLTDDVWSHHVGVGGPVDVRVTPEQWLRVRASGLDATVLVGNLQESVESEARRLAARPPSKGLADGPGWFDDFKTFEEHRVFLEDLAAAHPDLAEVIVVGKTLEGREIFGIRITGPGSVDGRPAVFYNGCQHAREWATPPTVAYIAYRLLTDYATDCRTRELVDGVEFFLVPIVNVDGYAYTWASAGNRYWRKNKRPGCTSPSSLGVDLNRNWGYEWGGPGSGTNPCDETYRGPSKFSEPETQAVRDYILARPRIRATMDFHSYGDLILSPWGYTSALPPDSAEFALLGERLATAMYAAHGVQYRPGPIYTNIYPAAGNAVDWCYGEAGALAFSIEVRGGYGFDMPPVEIIPNAQENYAAIVELSSYVARPLDIGITSTPLVATPGLPSPVRVRIANAAEELAPGSGLLRWRVGGAGAFTGTPLWSEGGAIFGGALPSVTCGSEVEYYFEARTTSGATVLWPPCAESHPLTVRAYTKEVVFQDTFEVDAGWTVVNEPGLTGGAWERADPVRAGSLANPSQPEDDYTPAPGVACFVTQNGPVGGNSGAADVDGGPTRLVSPALDLSGAEDVLVEYFRWAFSTPGNGVPDALETEISTDNGGVWAPMITRFGFGGWAPERVLLPAGVTPGAQTRLRFSISDLVIPTVSSSNTTEALIDDLVVSKLGCAVTCYPDCNGDGAMTIGDLACFQARYAAADPYANCDRDERISLADFGCFLTRFAMGCP